MKTFVTAGALLIALGSPIACAQDHPATPPNPENSSHSKGTAPDGMSSTAWTGGAGGSHIGKEGSVTTGSAPAAEQPEMATGKDLKGPPRRFPANNTPE